MSVQIAISKDLWFMLIVVWDFGQHEVCLRDNISYRGASGNTMDQEGKSAMQLALDMELNDTELLTLLKDSCT